MLIPVVQRFLFTLAASHAREVFRDWWFTGYGRKVRSLVHEVRRSPNNLAQQPVDFHRTARVRAFSVLLGLLLVARV